MVMTAVLTYWDSQRRIFKAQKNEDAAEKHKLKVISNRQLGRRKEVCQAI
jgi:hypothetical protein